MISYAALLPHPPLIVPEVGGDNVSQVRSTVEAMQEITREMLCCKPDVILFLTPHGNVFSDCFSCLIEPELKGNLEGFGRSDVSMRRTNDLTFIHELVKRSQEEDLHLLGITKAIAEQHRLNTNLDHGIMVPLYYLEKAGLDKQAIIAISVGLLDQSDLYRFGKLIQETADHLQRNLAVVASGDMSHRLKEEGPYEYHPDGSRFDEYIKDHLQQNDVEAILNIPAELRNNAGECGYPSIVIMLGALDGYEIHSKIFSYEGPFGVGYLTASLRSGQPRESIFKNLQKQAVNFICERRTRESAPVKWARLNLESHIKNEDQPPLTAEIQVLLEQEAAAFVSIKKNGQLRGCIGTFLPAYENLAEEIKYNALSAGLRDPRFSPIEAAELNSLIYSVDVLKAPESCARKDLDPATYGVIVSSSYKRGLLLPDLEGVDTVEKQLQIALQKAGISPREQYDIQRFEVQRFT